MANSGVAINGGYNMDMANLSVDQSHGSQLATISSIAAIERMFTPGSLHIVTCKRDFSVIRGIDIITNQSISLFSVAGQLFLTCAKPL